MLPPAVDPPSSDRLAWAEPYLNGYAACPLCEGKSWQNLYEIGILKVHCCRGCSLMFLNPCLMPEEQKLIFSSPEMLKKVSLFFAHYHNDRSWSTPKTTEIYRSVLAQMEGLLPGKGTLLDVGCGKGAFLVLAKEMGWQTVGLEPNFNAAETLRKQHDIPALDCDFFDPRVAEQMYDVISLWDLIEHTPNPKIWMERCRALLKPGGLLVIATPNHASLLDGLAHWACRLSFGRVPAGLEKLYTIDHTLYLTGATLADLFQRTDFRVLKTIKVNTDLSRYHMSAAFRVFAEILLAASWAFHLQNRVVMIGSK